MKLSTNHEKNKTTFRRFTLGQKCALRWQATLVNISSLNKTIDLTKNMSAMSIPKTPDKIKAVKSNASASSPANK